MRIAVIVMCLGMLLSGCGAAPVKSGGGSPYELYLSAAKAKQDAQMKAIGEMATACGGDGRCVEHVAAMAAIATMAGGGSGANVAPPPREVSGMEKFAQFMGAVSPMVGTVMQGVVQMRQTDASKDTSVALYGMLGGAVRDTTSAMGTVAANAKPNITVGGDYVQGDGNQVVRGNDFTSGTRTQVGRDLISGTQYQGPYAGRDMIGGDLVNGHVGNGDCSGDGCQPVTQPADDTP